MCGLVLMDVVTQCSLLWRCAHSCADLRICGDPASCMRLVAVLVMVMHPALTVVPHAHANGDLLIHSDLVIHLLTC